MTRQLTAGYFDWEALDVGDTWATGGLCVTEAHIVGFAGLSGDLFDVHMDDEFAREQGFEGRIAHGLLVLSLVDGLKYRSAVKLAAVASLGWNWTFSAPVLIGDRIHARLTVASRRPTRRADRGIATFDFEVFNQAGDIVQRGANTLMMQRLNAAGPDPRD